MNRPPWKKIALKLAGHIANHCTCPEYPCPYMKSKSPYVCERCWIIATQRGLAEDEHTHTVQPLSTDPLVRKEERENPICHPRPSSG